MARRPRRPPTDETSVRAATAGPPAGEIASIERDPLIPQYSTTLEPGDETLRLRGGGKGIGLYDEIRRDPHAFAVLQKRVLEVTSREWMVIPASDAPVDGQAAELVERQLKAIAFDRLSMGLLQAVLKGYAVGEVIWALRDGEWTVERVKVRRQRRFRFTAKGEPRLITREAGFDGIPLPPRKFVIHRHSVDYDDDDPYGLGIGTVLFWAAWFKRQVLAYWLKSNERHAAPTVVATYTGADDEERRKKLLGVIRTLATDAGIVVSSDVEVGLEYEVRTGLPGDAPVSLYPNIVIEEALSVELIHRVDGGEVPEVRWTAPDTARVSIDITFPGGLISYGKQGGEYPVEVPIRVRQQLAGSPTWLDVGTYTMRGQQADVVRRTIGWTLPSRGRWKIEVSRMIPSHQTNMTASRSVWTTLRSHKPEYPLNLDKPMALIAVRVKATKQLNGTLDTLTADTARICKDWDAATETWITRATRSPASLYRYVLQGPENARPTPDAAIDLAGLAEWHEFCAAQHLYYDRVHDFEATLWEVLTDVAAAGRASPRHDGERMGVVVDRPRSQVVAAITPRNAWNIEWERELMRFPDAFRVPFIDRSNEFRSAERIVPWPGFEGDPQLTEALELPGVTDPAQVWMATRRRQYELIHRPDRFTAQQEVAALESARGDLVHFTHFDLGRPRVTGKVVTVAGEIVELDEPVIMQAGQDYAVRFRRFQGAAIDQTWLRPVTTEAGETRMIKVPGHGAAPGDLAMFGPAIGTVEECIVAGMVNSENLAATVHMLPAAPIIDELMAGEVAPVWDGRVGTIIDPDADPPLAPVIVAITTGAAAGGDPGDVFVQLRPAEGSSPVGSYEVDHRLSGGSYSTVAETATARGGVLIAGVYEPGDEIDIRARAKGLDGVAGPYTAVTTLTIGETTTPSVASFAAVKSSGIWEFAWEIDDPPAGLAFEDIVGARIRWRPGSDPGWGWDDLTGGMRGVLTASPVLSRQPTDSGTITFAIVAVTSDGTESEPLYITATG